MSKKQPEDINLLSKRAGLAAHDICKSYRGRQVLSNANLRVKRGEAVGLLGPNGAGKTTCFSIVCGLIKPSLGQVTIDNQDVTHLPMFQRARLGVGYLPQESSIFRGLSVENNIKAVLEITEKDRSQRAVILDELLSEFNITHIARSDGSALSGGERRRVEIARALAAKPEFILLDEPFAGIDPIAVHDIRELISHLKDRGIGVLLTDHNVREALDIVDRAYILNDGQIMMKGTPSEIIADKNVRRVYLGESF